MVWRQVEPVESMDIAGMFPIVTHTEEVEVHPLNLQTLKRNPINIPVAVVSKIRDRQVNVVGTAAAGHVSC